MTTRPRHPDVDSTRPTRNPGYGWGGGILVAGVPATMSGNVVTDNFAPTIGSGVFWDEGAIGTMTGDLVVGNRCTTDGRAGAAIHVDGGDPGPSSVSAERITVVGHACADAPDGGAILLEAGRPSITSSILWANGVDVGDITGDGEFTIDNSTTSADDDPCSSIRPAATIRCSPRLRRRVGGRLASPDGSA